MPRGSRADDRLALKRYLYRLLGFIAVALVIFGMWSPIRAMVGAFLFGGAIGLQLQLQTLGVPLSPFILDMFPYVITLVVLSLWTGATLRAMPEGLKSVLRAGA